MTFWRERKSYPWSAIFITCLLRNFNTCLSDIREGIPFMNEWNERNELKLQNPRQLLRSCPSLTLSDERKACPFFTAHTRPAPLHTEMSPGSTWRQEPSELETAVWSQTPVNLQQLLKKMGNVQLQYKSPDVTAFKHISQVSHSFSVIVSSFFYFLPPTGTQKNLLGGGL